MANTTSTLNSALVAALSEIRNLPKDKVNPHFKSKFTSLDAILEATRPILAKHGLAITQLPAYDSNTQCAGVTTRIIHSSGETTESTLLLPVKDNTPIAIGSALSYSRRYSISAVLALASEEDEDGMIASTPKPVISKPAFTKKPESAPAPEPTTPATKDEWEIMFKTMEAYKVSEEQVRSFLLSKGVEVPEFLIDLPLAVAKRVNEKFADIVTSTKK
jgi:hypothetical protein